VAGAPRFFHIGYQRTGSTYLQQVVFPAFGDYIHHRSTGSFFADADEFALGPDHYLAMSPAPVTAPVIIETHNGMSGDTLDDRPEVAARIKAICPDARIMLGLRSQFTIMPSFHFLHVKGGASCTYGQYVELAIARRKFDFHRLVRTYTELFGAESLLVMFHEDLVRDRVGYVERVREFLEIPAGARRTIGNEVRKERPSDLAIRIMSATNGVMCGPLFRRSSSLLPRPRHLRRLRRRLNSYAGALAGLAPKSLQAAARIDAEAEVPIIEAAYGESNRALFGLLGKDIDDYPFPGAGGGAAATDSPTPKPVH
jgi:hypothetical protein